MINHNANVIIMSSLSIYVNGIKLFKINEIKIYNEDLFLKLKNQIDFKNYL